MEPRSLFCVVSIALGTVATIAQTTALDFSASDCYGTPHQLFDDLDAGNAVVLDFVMMNCPDCAPATAAIASQVIPNTIDPARVIFYSIGFDDIITCPEITGWASGGGVVHPVFAGMSDQTAYYGGMGMPTIVVLGGGSTHSVYYVHLGYAPGLIGIITNAINLALLDASGVAENGNVVIDFGPNPVTDVLNLGSSYYAAKVMDLQGRTVLLYAGDSVHSLSVVSLPAGHYFLELTRPNGSRGIGRFEKI